jgi:hypothetical protein
MNTYQALCELYEGKKITHENWDKSFYIYYRRGNVFDNVGEIGTSSLLACFTQHSNKGYHLFNRKRSALNVKAGDLLKDNFVPGSRFRVKIADEECVVLISLNDLSGHEAWSFEEWKLCHKNYSIVKG